MNDFQSEIMATPSGTFDMTNYVGQTSGNTSPASWFFDWAVGENQSDAGVSVNARSMLQLASIWQGVNLIAGDIGQIPVRLVRDKFDEQTASPAWSLLRKMPNDYQTAAVFKETIVQWMLLHGNAVVHIVRDRGGRPAELIPLHPEFVWPVITADTGISGNMQYHYTSPYGGESYIFRRDEVLHFKGLGDGEWGYPLYEVGKQALGHGIALQKFGNNSFKNATRPSGVLTHPGKPSPTARDLLREDWERIHAGADNAGKVAVLWEGMGYEAISQTHSDAQWIEAKRMARQEAASLLNLPLAMLNSYEDSPARATLEEMRTQYLQQTLTRWFNQLSQEFARKLLPSRQFRSGDFEFIWDTRRFLRGDIETSAAVAETLVSATVINPNEAREMFDLPPYPGGEEYGSPHINPRDDSVEPEEPEEPSDEEPDEAMEAHRRLLGGCLAVVVQKEYDALKAAAARGGNFLAWADKYYQSSEGRNSKLMHQMLSITSGAIEACESIGIRAGGIVAALERYADSRHASVLELASSATADTLVEAAGTILVDDPHEVSQAILTQGIQ